MSEKLKAANWSGREREKRTARALEVRIGNSSGLDEGARIEKNRSSCIIDCLLSSKRFGPGRPQVGTLWRLLAISRGWGTRGGKTATYQRRAGGIRSGGHQLFPYYRPVQRAVRGPCGGFGSSPSRRHARQQQGTTWVVRSGGYLPPSQEVRFFWTLSDWGRLRPGQSSTADSHSHFHDLGLRPRGWC